MHRLKLELEGRMPQFGEDQYYMETYLREGIQAILKAFDTDPLHGFVVHGCDYDTENDVISPGYIYLNGELIKVETQTTTPAANSLCYFTKSEVDGTARIFGDLSSKKVRLSQFGYAQWSTTRTDNSVLISDTLMNRISAGLINEGWKTFTLQSGYTHATPTLKYRKNKINNVEISGAVNGIYNGLIAILPSSPVNYRPPYDVTIPILTADGFNTLVITASNGYMTLGGKGSTSNGPHYIHGTLFMT